MYHSNKEIRYALQRLIAKQRYGGWPQQEAIEVHENGNIKTNIRLDVCEDDGKCYIKGYMIMHSKSDAKSLLSADTEYVPFKKWIVV